MGCFGGGFRVSQLEMLAKGVYWGSGPFPMLRCRIQHCPLEISIIEVLQFQETARRYQAEGSFFPKSPLL